MIRFDRLLVEGIVARIDASYTTVKTTVTAAQLRGMGVITPPFTAFSPPSIAGATAVYIPHHDAPSGNRSAQRVSHRYELEYFQANRDVSPKNKYPRIS